MSNTNNGQGQEPHGTTEATQQEPDQQDTQEQEAPDYEALYKETLEHSRKHEKRAKEHAAAAKRLAELEAANQTETERLTSRAETAEKTLTELQDRYHGLLKTQAITDAATTARAINVKAVAALIRDDVTVDEDGQVQGVDKALKALQRTDPDLFNTTPAGTRDANGGRNQPPALNSDALEESLRRAVGAH